MLHPAGCTSYHLMVAPHEDVGLEDLPLAFQLQDMRSPSEE